MGTERSWLLLTALPPSRFRCQMPCELDGATYYDPRFNESMIHPMLNGEYDYCQYINPDDTCTLFENPEETTKCSKNSIYLYDDFEYHSTIVTDLDLVCDEEYKVELIKNDNQVV